MAHLKSHPLHLSNPSESKRFVRFRPVLFTSLMCTFVLTALSTVDALHFWAGKFHLSIVDDETGTSIPVRMTLQRSNGKQVPVRRATSAGVGWSFDGDLDFDLAPDSYQFEISHGPEFKTVRGNFSIDRNASDEKVIRVPRIANMSEEGWFAGDPMVAVPERDIEIRMLAEGLHFVANTTRRSNTNSSPGAQALELLPANIRFDVVRGSGTSADLLALNIPAASLIDYSNDGPSSEFIRVCLEFAKQARNSSATNELDSTDSTTAPKFILLNPMSWDTPILLASQKVDAVGVFGEFLQLNRKQMTWRESRPPYGLEFTDSRGLGRWSEAIYLHMLEAGFQIPPLGYSAADSAINPIGYNRTYAYLGQQFDGLSERWWDAVWSGATVATNGPLLRPMVNDLPPGHMFFASSGESLELQLTLQLAIQDPVEYLEILRDGKVVYSARLDEHAKKGGILPLQTFTQSGWMSVRVMTKYADHYRGALTAPWYIVFDNQPRISRRAVEFFQSWLAQRESMLAETPAAIRKLHAPYVQLARRFWQAQLAAANAP